mmetsp:Transcript_40742/g.100242  ORF Transcript_40742/g.100242 Transcript_40742/m.100242 type:complete len:80 (+) Transcript_40742:252-491(+)
MRQRAVSSFLCVCVCVCVLFYFSLQRYSANTTRDNHRKPTTAAAASPCNAATDTLHPTRHATRNGTSSQCATTTGTATV